MEVKEFLLEKLYCLSSRRIWTGMFLYTRLITPFLVSRFRKQEKIRVLFIVVGVASWKTEKLYQLMLADSKFEPVIGIEESREIKGEHLATEAYCKVRGYDYVRLSPDERLGCSLKPHIVLYQKPYEDHYPPKHFWWANQDCLFVYVNYAFHSTMEDWSCNLVLHNIVKQLYFENELCASGVRERMWSKGRNIVVTGLPVMDELNVRKEDLADPWKAQDRPKKRIIWAPHHTIGDLHLKGIKYSTFLDYCDFMLQLAEKYKDEVQWAFKPHPRLILSLSTVWGEEKAKAYYAKWQALENAQLETGKYDGLFHHSDAMIHDCGSFMVEYHYTRNPVLFLTNDEDHTANLNDFAKRAYELHYKAANEKEIEAFVQSVIRGEDPRKAEREEFYRTCLLPPGGKTASENIVEAIKQMLA